jgi:hypothetical protein
MYLGDVWIGENKKEKKRKRKRKKHLFQKD